jgi:hypothetical protein
VSCAFDSVAASSATQPSAESLIIPRSNKRKHYPRKPESGTE